MSTQTPQPWSIEPGKGQGTKNIVAANGAIVAIVQYAEDAPAIAAAPMMAAAIRECIAQRDELIAVLRDKAAPGRSNY